jgi:hypothetical protein
MSCNYHGEQHMNLQEPIEDYDLPILGSGAGAKLLAWTFIKSRRFQTFCGFLIAAVTLGLTACHINISSQSIRLVTGPSHRACWPIASW